MRKMGFRHRSPINTVRPKSFRTIRSANSANATMTENPESKPDLPKSQHSDNVHTTLNLEKGGIKTYVTYIDPPGELPARQGLRYRLAPWTLGRLEELARSRFVISELADPHENLEEWDQGGHRTYDAIVQSVLASNAIEGETVYVKDAEVQATADTDLKDGVVTEEWKRRRVIGDDIYEAYIQALRHREDPVLHVGWILDIHKRMFSKLYPDTCGRLKREPVIISGGGFHIETVPPGRADMILNSIVTEFNRKWQLAHKHAEYCTFLIVAEFIVDFLAIHPFEDGNGRTARLLSTYLLERAGYHFARFYSLDNIIHETQERYYTSLYQAQKYWFTTEEDLTDWVNYYTDSVYLQYRRAFEALKSESIRRLRPNDRE